MKRKSVILVSMMSAFFMVTINMAAQAVPTTPGIPGSAILMIVVIGAIVFFLMIRPKQKKQKEQQDTTYLTAEPISRKRMALLWLDPPNLKQVGKIITEHGSATVRMGDSANMMDYEISQDDYDWAKQIEFVVNDAFSAAQRKDYEKTIQYYKKALDLAPGCDLFLMSIGSAYAHLGQKSIAVKYLERAANISPGNQRIKDNLNNIKRM